MLKARNFIHHCAVLLSLSLCALLRVNVKRASFFLRVRDANTNSETFDALDDEF